MKAKVIIPFKDKYTGNGYNKGDVIEVTANRFNEITKKGKFIQLVEDTPVTKESE